MLDDAILTKFASDTHSLDLDYYISLGGMVGLQNAIELDASQIIDKVSFSGLRGRGGAGFPTAKKWLSISSYKDHMLLCNADEGEPGTFKDRFILEKSPFLLLEGIIISALALQCHKAYIYVRGEYSDGYNSLQDAIAILQKEGYLGDKVLQKSFQLNIELKVGGGSYVVGDETALINSVMGNRGFPLLKPPYPTESGLWGKPTIVNNVETLANIAPILKDGGGRFNKIGNVKCPGTKLFSVSGAVKHPGVYELPMGVKVSEVIKAAGGVKGTFIEI